MKVVLILFFSLLTLSSCNFNKTNKNGESYGDILNKKEQDSQNTAQDTLGKLISTIEFGVKASGEDLKDFEDGIIPWISIDNPQSEIDKLISSDKIVVPYSEITLVIDYPLNSPASFVLKSKNKGFTKKELILEISKKYHQIYETEESTAKIKTVPVDKREGLINRNETDGQYGIWGHDIGDLDLNSIEVYKTVEGKIHLVLGIES